MEVKEKKCSDVNEAPTQFDLPPHILCEELEAIQCRRRAIRCNSSSGTTVKTASSTEKRCEDIKNKLVGLALSGGGIRSATFALGVMQRLAKEGCLKHVDYLSTVSGGGYIGGSLTWFLSQGFKNPKTKEPFSTTAANFPYGVDDPREKRLREKQPRILEHLRLHGKYLIPGKCITVESLIGVVLRGILLNLVVWLPLATAVFVLLSCLTGSLVVVLFPAGMIGILFLGCSLCYSFSTWLITRRKPTSVFKNEDDAYKARRKFAKCTPYLLRLGLLSLALGSLPWVHSALQQYIHHAGFGPLLLGIAGGLSSFVSSKKNHDGKIPLRFLAPLASFFLLYGLVLASYGFSLLYSEYYSDCSNWALGVGLAVLVISVGTGWFANLNYISIHKYYRDRLMEAFMPNPGGIGKCADAKEANKAKLSDMCSTNAPYHLVNTNVVLVDSDDPRWKVRGGDAFLLSPKYCGSTATDWQKTTCYMKDDPLTLATAVAISGAAANPNTASGGSGPTRNPALSLLMALLNIRLGYWVPHPTKQKALKIVNHFHAAWRELSPRGYEENQKMLQLSDGSHFENLGVYELVRRKVKLIICCDASADPGFKFTDLQNLVRRIGSDLGARIVFNKPNHLERLIPRDQGVPSYPPSVKFADQGHINGTIAYSDNTKGTLILLKSTMIRNVGLLLKGYKGANPVFPDQSTADQFFDEEQFEAYRELGYEIAKRMICDVDLKALLGQCR